MVDDDRDIDIETDGDEIEMNGSVRRVGDLVDAIQVNKPFVFWHHAMFISYLCF